MITWHHSAKSTQTRRRCVATGHESWGERFVTLADPPTPAKLPSLKQLAEVQDPYIGMLLNDRYKIIKSSALGA